MKFYLKKNDKQIVIVWHLAININNPNHHALVEGQANDIINSGVLEDAILHINLISNKTIVRNFNILLQKLLYSYTYYIHKYYDNLFEYRSINLMHKLSFIYPDSIFCYIHTKGMFFNNFPQDLNKQARPIFENALTKYTIYPYKIVLNVFKNNNHIMKAGLFPTPHANSFMWMNFFWIRGSYLKHCKSPSVPPNEELIHRYIYEEWISTYFNNFNNIKNNETSTHSDSYSLISKSNKTSEFVLINDIGIHLMNFPIHYDKDYLQTIRPYHLFPICKE